MKNNLTNKHIVLFLFLVCLDLSFSITMARTVNFRVYDLKCGYQTNPIGIDGLPQLSWTLESDSRAMKQSAYRIVVSTSLDQLEANNGNIWDSEKVDSSKSTGISYDGPQLNSRQRYYWKVQVWDNNQNSRWSEPAFFEMGLLKQEDWISGWIGYVPGMPGRTLYFKGTYVPHKPIGQARAYISGLGYYELFINLKKVGDHVLDPAQSNYSKRVYYVTYDIGEYLSEVNSIVIPVAQGWLGTPRLRIQVEIDFQDGTKEILSSDRFRSVTTGPIMYSTIFDGEHYDARLDVPDIYKPGVPQGLMNKDWAWAHNTDDPVGEMVAQKVEPIRIVETIVPKVFKEVKPGIYIVDAGRNLAGWAALKVQGKSGRMVTLRFAETLYENGLVNQENLRNAKVADTYILKGGGVETWEPAFTYHGFRYIQIEGLPKAPAVGDIQVKVVRSDVAKTGTFKCSSSLLNDIHQMVVNTEASNLHSVPTDCPQRDERMGWLNDLTVRIEQAMYNFDMARFYPKFMDDVSDTQDSNGTITCVAPFRFGMRPADPVSASFLLMAQKCYEFYGNRNMVEEHYGAMKGWVDYLYSRTEKGIVDYSYYGDWCPPKAFLMDASGSGVSRDTPGKLMSTGYLYYCAQMLSDMGKITGRDVEAERYKKMADEIAEAFNREYWNEETGGYASNNQASNSFALYLGLVDDAKLPRVVNNLVEDVKKHDYHLTTGNLCTKYLLEMLTEHGYVETAYRIVSQTTYPSWGFMLSKGATTLWERWEYATGDAMNSHNHPMMGSADSWFYKYLLGINPDFNYPAFERFTIRPYIVQNLDWVEGEFISEKGAIKSAWSKKNNSLVFTVSVPGNTTAEVYVPTRNSKTITESGNKISKVKGIKFIKEEKDYAVFELGSGTYKFQSEWK